MVDNERNHNYESHQNLNSFEQHAALNKHAVVCHASRPAGLPRAVRGVGGRGYSTDTYPVTSPLPPAHYQQDHTRRNVHAAFHQRTHQCRTLQSRHAPPVQNPVDSHQAMETAVTGSRHHSTCTPNKNKSENLLEGKSSKKKTRDALIRMSACFSM